MTVALTGATVPAAGKPNFTLADNEMELGIGIHGEPGRERVPMLSADQMVDALLEPILSDLDLKRGEEVIAFTNGMGGTPLLELYLGHREVRRLLDAQGREIPFASSQEQYESVRERINAGELTSLEDIRRAVDN